MIRITDRIVSKREADHADGHPLHAAGRHLGDRIVMMHRGQILHDLSGAEKRRLRPQDLLERFEEVRRADLLDESAAEMLRRMYV